MGKEGGEDVEKGGSWGMVGKVVERCGECGGVGKVGKGTERCGKVEDKLREIAASIGTEVLRYYCRAGLFGSKCDLSMQISPLGDGPVSALSIPMGRMAHILC